jgi:hypothetical protein
MGGMDKKSEESSSLETMEKGKRLGVEEEKDSEP